MASGMDAGAANSLDGDFAGLKIDEDEPRNNMKNDDKSKHNGGGGGDMPRFRPSGRTTFGEEVIEHEVSIRRAVEEEEKMRTATVNFLLDGPTPKSFEGKRFVVVHFNYYCADSPINPKHLVPAELSLQVFSLCEGLLRVDKYREVSGLVDPGIVPIGMRAEAVEIAQVLKVPMIGKGLAMKESVPDCIIWDSRQAYAVFQDVTDTYSPLISGEKLVFVARDHIPVANRCLQYLMVNSGIDESEFHGIRFASLGMLVLELNKLVKHASDNPAIRNILTEGHAERMMEHSKYEYDAELACRWHANPENADSVDKCSCNIVKRTIFNVLAYIRSIQGLPVYPPFFKPRLAEADVVDQKTMETLKRDILRDVKENEERQTKWEQSRRMPPAPDTRCENRRGRPRDTK